MKIFHNNSSISGSTIKKSSQFAGFTIIEMMVAIAVVAILTALALPSLTNFLARNEVAGSANSLIAGINLARSEAVARTSTVSICPSDDGATCTAGTWNDGFLVFVDVNGNSVLNAGTDELLRAEAGTGSQSRAITASNDINAGFTYAPSGTRTSFVGGGTATLTISNTHLTTGTLLTINASGQPISSKVTTT